MSDNAIKSLEEAFAEMDAYRATFRGRMGIRMYAVRSLFNRIIHAPRKIKWFFQRGVRGYADVDSWNADNYLAKQIAGLMQTIMDKGHGVSTFYCNGDINTPVEKMVELRDQDYKHIIAIFTEYSKNGVAIDRGWKKEFGGVFDKELEYALQWLSKHFEELWD